MKVHSSFFNQWSAPKLRPLLVLVILLAVITSACGGGGAGGSVSATMNPVSIDADTLSWMPPTQNSDGSPLTDLTGYKIYYGNESGNYHTIITIDNPGITAFMVENLSPNTYFFVMTAFNKIGNESDFSNEVSMQVR